MIYDLQKASILKRISAYLLDLILVIILATGFALAISAISDFGGKLDKIEKLDAECVKEFQLDKYLPVPEGADENFKYSMNITEESYKKMTDEGKAAARHVQQRAALAVELAGAGLSDSDREVFYRSLELITANLQTLSKEGLPQG